MKYKEQTFMMEVAKLAATQSKGIRLKVGGVVCSASGDLIAYAYNGMIRNAIDDKLEDKFFPFDDARNGLVVNDQTYPYFDELIGKPYRLVTKPDVAHCEENLIAHAARRGISVNKGIVYLTHSPCMHCTAMMIQSGISDVYFFEEYRTHQDVVLKYGSYININQWN